MAKRNNLSYLLLIVSFILILSSLYYLNKTINEKPLKVYEFGVEFEVIEQKRKGGFNPDSSALIFGKTSPGGPELVRFVNITNSYDFPIEARTFLTKEFANLIVINSSYFIDQGESSKITITLVVPEDYEVGIYEGKIKFELHKYKGL